MTIVYTTIFGASDSLKPAPAGADSCICFVDDPSIHADAKGWRLRRVMTDRPRRTAWHMRCVPHQLFDDYSRVIWLDASFTLTDLPRLLKDAGTAPIAAIRHHRRHSYREEAEQLVKVKQATPEQALEQVEAYQRAGFRPNHLSIASLIVRDGSDDVRKFNETWDHEIDAHPGDNTQVSLDYAAWVSGLTIKALAGDRHVNPYATHDYRDHRRRRRPYPGQPEELNR